MSIGSLTSTIGCLGFTHAWSVEHAFNQWGQLLARCALIDRFHVDLKRGETTCKSLVDME